MKRLTLHIEAVNQCLADDIANGPATEALERAQKELCAQLKYLIERFTLTSEENAIEYDAIPF